MDEQALKQAVLAQAIQSDGKIKLTCEKAFVLSKTHKVSLMEIGRICNENGIKINQCQLGCFK